MGEADRPQPLVIYVGLLDLSHRHPATQQIYRWFRYDHLPLKLQAISAPSLGLANRMILDCFVRAALDGGP